MSQVDNRNSSAAKRARTDGGRREDDWTCPSCGNVNFSFRTTCNMRNCTQPRPADHNSKSAVKPLQAPPSYPPSAPYVGSSTPSSMYMGVPPYGSSLFNATSMPPYDVPFTGGSAYHYNYGSRLNGGSPYRPPLHLSGPAPYSAGSMIGNGGMYAVPPLMDRYGLGLPIGTAAMGPRPGFFPDDKSQKRDGTRDNDWICPKCSNVNFSFRSVCNMRKCNTPKPGSQAAKSGKNSKPDMPEGSWKCEKCNNINYPFRTKCNRQNCGADKPTESRNSPSKPADENDQETETKRYSLSNEAILKWSSSTVAHVENEGDISLSPVGNAKKNTATAVTRSPADCRPGAYALEPPSLFGGDDVSGAAGVLLPPAGVGEAVPLPVKIAASGEFGGRLSNLGHSVVCQFASCRQLKQASFFNTHALDLRITSIVDLLYYAVQTNRFPILTVAHGFATIVAGGRRLARGTL